MVLVSKYIVFRLVLLFNQLNCFSVSDSVSEILDLEISAFFTNMMEQGLQNR